MSYIIDALRKAESSREATAAQPIQFTVPTQAPRSRFWLRVLSYFGVFAIAYFLGVISQPFLPKISIESVSQKTTSVETYAEEVKLAQDKQSKKAHAEERNNAHIQQLELSIISFADAPEQRFAVIDGTTVKEGELLQGNIRVLSIHRNSIELYFNGSNHTLTL